MNRYVCLCLVVLSIAAAAARADIFQWEYVNPADPSQGKQQSTTLCQAAPASMPCRTRI